MASTTPIMFLFFRSIRCYFRGWRYRSHHIFVGFVSMYLGWILLAGDRGQPSPILRMEVVSAVGAGLLALLAIFLINDAADRDIDIIAHPERPIPKRESDWRHIYAFGLLLVAASVALSWSVNAGFALSMVSLGLFAVLHYRYFKRHLPIPCSSEVLTPVVSAMFPISAFAVAGPIHPRLLTVIVLFIYSADLSHDMLGGIHDQEGDRKFQIRTFALAFGNGFTLRCSFLLFLLSVFAGVLVAAWGGTGWFYATSLSIMAALMLFQYARLFRSTSVSLPEIAGKVNHFGGFYFFIVSASLLPDYLFRRFGFG